MGGVHGGGCKTFSCSQHNTNSGQVFPLFFLCSLVVEQVATRDKCSAVSGTKHLAALFEKGEQDLLLRVNVSASALEFTTLGRSRQSCEKKEFHHTAEKQEISLRLRSQLTSTSFSVSGGALEHSNNNNKERRKC